MPYADFGKEADFEKGKNIFIRLKNKDEKATFRILGKPFYKAQHFQKNKETNKWDVWECPKIMSDEYCPDCEASFSYYKEAKKKKAYGATDEQIKPIKEKAQSLAANVKFYYPVLHRDTEMAKILEVSISVRYKIDDEVKLGRDVTKFDYTLLVTKIPGSAYYNLNRVDSAEAKPFTEKELKQIEVAKAFDLEDIVTGVKESSQNIEAEEAHETTVDDFPSNENKSDEDTQEPLQRQESNSEVQEEQKDVKKKSHEEEVNLEDLPF